MRFRIVLPLAVLLAACFCATVVSTATGDDSKSGNATWRGQSITEFTAEEVETFDWQVVNDGVMGGLSKGNLEFTEDQTMKFSGNLSLKNNGGFSTVRSKDVEFDLSASEGLLLKVKGDGRTYDARLSSDARFRSWEVSFSGKFETKAGEWTQVKIPFSSFEGSFRGMELPDQKLNPAKVRRVGVLLGDKKEGPFNLEVEWIRTYGQGNPTGQKYLTSKATDPKDIVQTAVSDGRFKTLATALTKAELVDVLQSKDQLTVFAPTDAAFAKLPKETVSDLLKPGNKEKLKSILTYHVVAGSNPLSAALKAENIPTVQGSEVTVAFSKGKVRVNESALIDADIQCSNGIIHVIDSVLLPPEPPRKTLLTVAEKAGGFTTLLAAVEAAGLSDLLEGDGPFTVFAPTDKAFASLPKGTLESLILEENREQLVSILKYHVVPGRVSAGDALNAGKADSAEGSPLRFSVSEGLLKVNESTILSIDIDGGNGIIHPIDSVLTVPENSKSVTKSGSKSSQKQAQHSNPMALIVAAIEKGVPLYNGGNAKACADVYRECISQLSKIDSIDSKVRKMLTATLERGSKHDSSVDRAWLYRSALDGMAVYFAKTQS